MFVATGLKVFKQTLFKQKGIKQVAQSNLCTFCLYDDGTLMANGKLPDSMYEETPAILESYHSKIIQVAATEDYYLMLLESKEILFRSMMGIEKVPTNVHASSIYSTDGYLGFIEKDNGKSIYLKTDPRSGYKIGLTEQINDKKFNFPEKIFQMALNEKHAFALGESGKIYKTIGLPPYKCEFEEMKAAIDIRFTQISGSINHVLALLVTGDVYSFGNNECGQLGSQCICDMLSFIKIQVGI